jgi:hypothetical protein
MSVQSSVEGPHGQSKNAGPYRRTFVKQVHSLLALGYARLDLARYRKAQEPAITGELVRQIRLVIDDRDSQFHSWAHRYAIHDDPPQNVRGRKGKERPRVDIEMERTQRGPHARFQFEAKKLPVSRKDAVGEYVGEKGLGCFISGQYAATHDDAGMVAYVQSGSVADWVEKVKSRLEKERDACELAGDWKKARIIKDIEHCFCSAHGRKRIGKGLLVYHSFLSIN